MTSGPPVREYRESPLARTRSFQAIRPNSPELDDAIDNYKLNKTKNNFSFDDTRDNFKFDGARDDFKFNETRDEEIGRNDRGDGLRRENSNLEDYKSLSAQDFEKSLMMEEKLAMEGEEEKNSYQNNQNIASVDGFNDLDSNFNNFNSINENRKYNSNQNLSRTGLEKMDKMEKLSPTVSYKNNSVLTNLKKKTVNFTDLLI